MECVSTFFANTEELEIFGCKELDAVCQDFDLVKLCDEVEANLQSEIFDPRYDDEMCKICAMVENSNSHPPSSFPQRIQVGLGGRQKRSAEVGDTRTAKRPRNEEGTSTSTVDKTALQYIQADGLKGKRITFLCGDAGPLALATVISQKLDAKGPADLPDYKIFSQRLLALMSRVEDSPDEMLYGKSGYLFALLFVNYHLGKEVIPGNQIEKVVKAILKSGLKYSSKVKSESPLLWQWHDKVYLGAAHGVAGILYMLLQAKSYVSAEDMQNYIRPTLDWLMFQQYKSNNFPSSLGSPSDRLVQWCHGAPGFVPLCILASQVFEDMRYMKIALECGEVIWKRGLTSKGYSLCHGVSGNAYAFVQLYQVTKQPKHLYRAACFMDWCISEQPGSEQHEPDRPGSLFEGFLGRIHLAHDFMNLDEAKFPAMTV